MRTTNRPVLAAVVALLAACGGSHESSGSHAEATGDHGHDHDGEHDHDHGQDHGQDPAAHETEPGAPSSAADDDHAERPLGTARVGELELQLAQGHGAVAAGKEGHLVVKLPYSDGGSSVVRAWIGSADRTLSYVGKAQYTADHDDYDVHATAPDPLPADARWWIEVEQPDGSKVVGSAQPLFE